MAWDFAAEIHALTTFDADLAGTTGSLSGENLTLHVNQWLNDGAKEIINTLPSTLLLECSTTSTLDNTATTLTNLDSKGPLIDIIRKDGVRFQPCRVIPPTHRGRIDDPEDLFSFATKSDPVYYIVANTLHIKPTPTATETAEVTHVAYPTVVFSNDTINNFPDQAEYLVVLYAASKALQHRMNELQTKIPIHSDQDGSYSSPSASSQGWEIVRNWLEGEEDTEMASMTMQALNNEMQQFVGEYQWYQSQLAQVKQDYIQGLKLIAGGGVQTTQAPPAQRAQAEEAA